MSQPVAGIQLGVAQAGIKKPGKDDLLVIALAPGASTAAVFTQNAFSAAPVRLARDHLAACDGQPAYLLVNTGNANAGTGEPGMAAAQATCDAMSHLRGCAARQVLPFSTGVIGELLPAERVSAALPAAIDNLSEDNWVRAASAILTTDTRAKCRSVAVEYADQRCVITGIAKGAGMICPNMATMLAFIGTDAKIDGATLQQLLTDGVVASFNRITVDGDTSTNDAVTLSATGASGVVIAPGSAACAAFADALQSLMIELAHDIVRDGEGATKFVQIRVTGGETRAACDQVARTIAHSPLVKTALFASDPNWGRILAAIGRAGLEGLDTGRVSIAINGTLIAEGGARAASYTEEQGQQAMSKDDLTIDIALNRGEAEALIWTTDLSYDYVKINAEYRT